MACVSVWKQPLNSHPHHYRSSTVTGFLQLINKKEGGKRKFPQMLYTNTVCFLHCKQLFIYHHTASITILTHLPCWGMLHKAYPEWIKINSTIETKPFPTLPTILNCNSHFKLWTKIKSVSISRGESHFLYHK